MRKEYNGNIKGFSMLEKALKEGFNVFKGHIDIGSEKLTSLGSLSKFSYSVKGVFICTNNQLTSLNGCPKNVGGDFKCSSNKLISLEGGPTYVSGDFYCYNNNFIPLEKKKGNIFKLGESFYIGSNIDNKNIEPLIKIEITTYEQCQEYLKSFNYFIKEPIKLDRNEKDIIFNGKKFKRKFLKI